MCRFTIYKGHPILLGDIIIKPENSLLCQARNAAYHPGVEDDTHHRNIIVNGNISILTKFCLIFAHNFIHS